MYETIERPLIPVLLGMETAGIKVDAPRLRTLSAEFEKRMGELEREIHKIAGREFNVGSPKQLGEMLFDEQKLPGGKRNKTGSWATDVSILEDLADQGHALPVKILEQRQIAKLKGTYTDALVREIDAKTGRVHTSYHMTGAATGPALLDRSQPAEHPGAHRGGPQDPRRLHRRAGPQAALGRLFADRAAAAGARRRHRLAEGGFRARRRHPRHHRQRGVRRAGQGHGPAGAPARQGHQLRHHLRHLGLRPGPPARHRPAGGARVHRQVLRALSRHPRLHGDDQGGGAQATAT